MQGTQVTIPAAKPVIIEGVKDGRPWRIVKQAALFTLPNGNVEGGSILAPRNKAGEHLPYAPGTYALAPESISVREGELTFTPRLVPVSGGTK